MTRPKPAKPVETGKYGTIHRQFKGEPVKAIRYLMNTREGEAIAALYRADIGYIDIVWGDDKSGLKHILDKHGKEIEQLGFKPEYFIPIIVQYGEINLSRSDRAKKVYEGKMFRFVIAIEADSKKWLLTAFDLRPTIKKRPK